MQLLTNEHISMFVVKSIHIQIIGRAIDLSMTLKMRQAQYQGPYLPIQHRSRRFPGRACRTTRPWAPRKEHPGTLPASRSPRLQVEGLQHRA